jgi:hypothetical protein
VPPALAMRTRLHTIRAAVIAARRQLILLLPVASLSLLLWFLCASPLCVLWSAAQVNNHPLPSIHQLCDVSAIVWCTARRTARLFTVA